MNIGIFTDNYLPQVNGVATSIMVLEKELRKLGHNVYIFTPSHPKADDNSPYVYRLPSVPFVFLKDYRVSTFYSNKVLRQIKRLKLDIIASQTEFSMGLFAKIVSKKFSIPIIHTYHTMYEDYMHYISKGIEVSPVVAQKYSKYFCNHVDALIVPTKKTERILKSYGVTTQMRIIPTGIDFSPFRKEGYTPEEIQNLKSVFHIPENAPVLLFIGRLAKEKSIDVILYAMQILVKKMPEAILFIVGDGPSRLELAELTTKLGIQDNVIFAGLQPWNTIGKFYQVGDVFVNASVSETQGLTFAEAMAASLPVVAKNDESISGLIRDGYNGKIFETPEELAGLLHNMLYDKDYLAYLGANAVQSVSYLSSEIFGMNAYTYYCDVIDSYKEKHTTKKGLFKSKKQSSQNKKANS